VTRSESRRDSSETDFNQFVFHASYDINESMTLSGMFGSAQSEFVRDYFRINLDSPAAQFEYDFGSSDNIASLIHGYDVSDISLYSVTNPDVRQWAVDRDNQTFRLDLTWEEGESTMKTGLIANDRRVDSAFSRSTGGSFDAVGSDVDAVDIGEALPVSDFGTALSLPGVFPTTWAVIDLGEAESVFGRGDTALREDNGSTFDITEETLGAYIDFTTTSDLMGLPLHSNFGVRVVETTTKVKGVTSVGPVEIDNSYVDVLPSANFAWEVDEDVQLRLAMGRAMTRPPLSSLRSNNSYEEISGRVNGGNPELDPIRSTNVDVAAEWYFSEGSVLGVTYFHKAIEGLLVDSTFDDFIDPAIADAIVSDPNFDPGRDIDPRTNEYTFSVPISAGDSEISGFELFYQQGFDEVLPAPFNNMGIIANYTAVDASTELNGQDVDFEGLSDSLYNFTVYYETDTFGIRLSTNYRSDYITDITGSDGNAEHGTSGQTRYDLSAVYNLNDNISFTLEGINLTNEEERLFTTGDGSLDLVREFNTTGRQIFLGVRANF
jgi:TonB-dependent receptor